MATGVIPDEAGSAWIAFERLRQAIVATAYVEANAAIVELRRKHPIAYAAFLDRFRDELPPPLGSPE